MRLENSMDPSSQGGYNIKVGDIIDPSEMICEIYDDMIHQVSIPVISSRFHHAMLSAIVKAAANARERSGLNTAVLSGGVFQNRFLLEKSQVQR